MRVGNLRGRAVLIGDAGALDVHDASAGRYGPDPSSVFERWADFSEWASSSPDGDWVRYDDGNLGPPSPNPRQVIAIGLNYAKHAAESGIPTPEFPTTFTKFPSCLTGPHATVRLPGPSTDWEVELVAIVGIRAENVLASAAWDHIAGLTVGQDLSEREVQMRPPMPQFSLGKSFPGFGPTGPWLVTPDEFPDPDDLALCCSLNGETVQDSRTSDLIFSIPVLVQELSAIVALLPGDIIFTGTPSGVGMARDPQRFLAAGDELVTTIEGIGSMVTSFVGPTT